MSTPTPSNPRASPTKPTPSPTIQNLRENHPHLWYKLHVFIYDLRKFRSNAEARMRLECVIDEHYLGLPYFSESESEILLNTILHCGYKLRQTLDDFLTKTLERRLKGRMKETSDYRVCAAHDLAPLFEKAFDVKAADLAKNKAFLRCLDKGGLESKEGAKWKGLRRGR